MKKIILQVLSLLVVFIITGCKSSFEYDYVTVENMEVFTLQYRVIEDVDSNYLSLDIYTDSSFINKPVIMYVHGGGLKKGDKTNAAAYLAKSNYFVSNDYVYVSINYRLSPEVVSPSHIEDVANAFMYIYENISNYGGDPTQIFIMGHSAGAYLVSLLATNEIYIEQAGGNLSMIEGVISLDTWTYMSIQGWQQEELSDDPLERIEAIPGNHVDVDKSIPPFLIFYRDGRKESAVEADQLAFVNLLTEKGYHAAAILCVGDSHLRVNQEVGTIDDQKTEIIMEYLDNPLNINSIAETYQFKAN
jgi:arylformamidase